MNNKHVIKVQQFAPEGLSQIFIRTDQIRKAFATPEGRAALKRGNVSNKLVYSLFYEPSTRTRFSFETACYNLGIKVIGTEDASQFSSTTKGETLEDTIRVLCGYFPDAIIIRHKEAGAATRAARVSSVPIINAGDGANQHPTQALLDLYAIWDRIGRLNDLNIIIGGDLANGRTVRSLIYLLSKFDNNHFVLCSPQPLKMKQDIISYLDNIGASYKEITQDLEKYLPSANVVYWTRVQRERMKYLSSDKLDALERQFTITKDHAHLMRPDGIIMHPLPRVSEISTEVDSMPQAAYFDQASNGMFVRMALLENILSN